MKKVYKHYPEYDRELTAHYGSTNHCTVIALAIAFHLSTGKAYNAAKIAGQRQDFSGVSYFNWKRLIADVAKRFNYKVENVRDVARLTLNQVTKRLPNKGAYIIDVKGHTCTYRDGVLEDWTKPDYSNRKRNQPRHRVEAVYRVYK